MSTPTPHPQFRLSKSEILSYGILVFTVLYVVAAFLYPRSPKPTQTETFKIVSKEFVPEENPYLPNYRKRGRYGTFRPRSTLIPAHYRVYIQWGEETYTIQVPLNKAYLLKHEKIAFTYRISDDGWLRLLEFHELNGHTESIEILEFGIFAVSHENPASFEQPKLISQTAQVPAKIGTAFGFTFKTKGSPPSSYTELTLESVHPGLNDPDSDQPIYQNELPITVKLGVNDFHYYILEYDWELVPGQWIFKVKNGDRVLAEKTFTLVKP
ncbi:MAG: DUF3859 domain-containing protein [Verrucomicrobiales bacterium]|nr:DUF3859 domain-containing protein [Verrucomicrobiales bacterium]